MTKQPIHIIGAGLAGSEAAWQVAQEIVLALQRMKELGDGETQGENRQAQEHEAADQPKSQSRV